MLCCGPLIVVAVALPAGLMAGLLMHFLLWMIPARLEEGWRRQCERNRPEGWAYTPWQATGDLRQARLTCARCGRAAHMLNCSPLLSWLFHAGRCPGCRARVVPPLATLPELLAIGAAAAVMLRFGPSAAGALALLFAWGLILLGLLSWLHALMPDVLTYGLLWAGLALNLGGTYVPLEHAVAGAVSGYLVPWAFNRAVRLVRGRDLLGYGAMKAPAAVGAWLGPAASLVVFAGALTLKLAGWVLHGEAATLETLFCPIGPQVALCAIAVLLWLGPAAI